MKTDKTSINQARDTGLALVLLLLLLVRAYKQDGLILLAIAVLVLTMVWPALFTIPARLWFGLAELLGTLSSKILLSIAFVLVLTPVAALRKMSGADPMKRNRWKKDTDSVFVQREHGFVADDLKKPY